MAFANRGDIDQAHSERVKMLAIKKTIKEDALLGMLNKAHHVFGIADRTLNAKIAEKTKNYSEAERQLVEAVKLEDDLTYMEPPDWLNPSREALGALLLRTGKPAAAEKVFREDLDRAPRGGRSLFGLWKSLEAQNKTHDAQQIERQFKTAWENADTQLTIDGL
jgi:hypothetical protein